jgi:hypothetical protein
MPFFRNFTYWIDKRKWKYIFLLATLELSRKAGCRLLQGVVKACSTTRLPGGMNKVRDMIIPLSFPAPAVQ